jgi:hypothetical protein
MPDCYPHAWDKPAEAFTDLDLPVVTDHAADAWNDRTPHDSVAPETAWDDAEPDGVTDNAIAAYIETHTGVAEARYHRPTGTALLRRGPCIVTVLPSTDSRVSAAVMHARPDEGVKGGA